MDRYAVFGNPIAHSLSPKIHQAFAEQTQQRLSYETVCPQLDNFAETARHFLTTGGNGLNVTIPFKEQAYNFVEKLTARAQCAKAVNTIGQTQGEIWGDNTDGIGLIRDLRMQNIALSNSTILIVGAGGAVRGVLAPLLEQQPHSIVLTNRTHNRAIQLVDEFKTLGAISAKSCDDLMGMRFDLIIHGSAAGLHNTRLPLPSSVIAPDHTVCYDMMYSAQHTLFNQWAQQHNAQRTLDGLGMLVEQAAEAFYLWRGVRPETEPVRTLIRNSL